MADYNGTNYPAFTTKEEMVLEIHRVFENKGDLNHLLKRIARSDTTGFSDGAAMNESTFASTFPHF